METQLEFEKEIIETKLKYKDIIFGNDSRICKGRLNELPEQGDIEECTY